MTTSYTIRAGLVMVLLAVGWVGNLHAQVLAVQPASQVIQAPANTSIQVTFAKSINSASVGAMEVFVFGRWSGVAAGEISYEANNTVLHFTPDKSFMAGEWVTVSLSKNIQFADGETLGFGYTWNFWTEAARTDLAFQQIGEISTREKNEPLIRSYGAYAGDLNQDGFSDLMIPNEVANDIRVFLNDGAGWYNDFTIYPIPNGSVPSTNEGSDFNRDGLIDFAVGNTGNDLISVWMGMENGAVTHSENVTADQNIRGLCILDLDGDAIMDIVTANRTGSDANGNLSLLLNDGTGKFTGIENMETNSVGETACASIDANNDGLLDVFIGSYQSNQVLLFLGDGQGGLTLAGSKPIENGPWMLAAGDMNGDGFGDVVSGNTGSASVSVLLGNGDGTLKSPMHFDTGQFPLAIDVGDLDGDGDLDVVTSNFSSNDFTVLENDGTGRLTSRITLPAVTAASCTILHDRDNDGDLDITGIDELADRIFLFDNPAVPTSVEDEFEQTGIKDALLHIESVFPNPSSNKQKIRYTTMQPDVQIQLEVFNLLGQKISSTHITQSLQGTYQWEWDGRNESGDKISRGVYLYKISAQAQGHSLQHTGQLVRH